MKLPNTRLLGVLLVCHAVAAQIITTVAGTDFHFPTGPLAALDAPLGYLSGVAIDGNGIVYLSDSSNNIVLRLTPDGTLTVVAGNGIAGFSGDGGPATSASLNSPQGLAVDSAGNLYIADSLNSRVRKVSGGIITTAAGNGEFFYYTGDGGPATNAALNYPHGVAVDTLGDLYIADTNNDSIREVTNGVINTVVGGRYGFAGDGGPATAAALSLPEGVAVDSTGNIYIADTNNNRLRKVAGGIITTIAGNGVSGFAGDGGSAVNASLNSPEKVAVDPAGNLYIADGGNDRIRKVAGGTITTVAGNGSYGFSGDGGPATSASLFIGDVAVDSAGNLYIADLFNERIRKVSSGRIGTIAGNGDYRFSGDGGPAISAALNIFFYDANSYSTGGAVAVDSTGNVYIADTFNNRVRRVARGTITTVAGNGASAYSGDGGPATSASLTSPLGVAVDSAGNLYIADTGNNRIRKVSNGTITTVAGNGIQGFSGDEGPATSASLSYPYGVALDLVGNLYVADTSNNRIRKVSGGTITTVAGNGVGAYSGDGGPATSASLFVPSGVAVDSAGNLYIADSFNDVIRKVSNGTITTVVTSASFGHLAGVAVDSADNLYIVDSLKDVIREVSNGTITTVAGNGNAEFSGDGGPATSAELNGPNGVAVDASGNLFIADSQNNRIRVVLAAAPAVIVAPQQLSFSASSNGAPATPQTVSLTSPVDGLSFNATAPSWLQVNPTSGASPRLIQVIADPTGLAPMTYQANITISTPNGNPTTTTVAVTFTVTAAVPPALSVDKASLSFPFPQQGSARSQTLTVSNTGGGTLQFNATPTTTTGGNWLSVSPASAQALPGSPVTLTITANPTGLRPGAYSGQVTITAGSQSQIVAVTMTISTRDQAILLSQSGLSFLAVNSGGVIPAQSFGVQNIGTGVVNWTASTSTLSGGPDWLQVMPATGSSDAAAATSPRVTVSVNGAALPTGTYYGLVRVDAPGAANTPQVLTVFLQVLASNAVVAPVVQPAQLLFTATAGGESPGSQLVQVYNIVPGAKSFQSAVGPPIPGLSLITLPQDATLDPLQPTSIVVQPLTSSLSAGVYNETLTLQFSDGTVSAVQVSVIVSNGPASTASSRSRATPESSTNCTPSKLIPALTTLGQTFTVSAGWPTALIVNVTDDCGMPLQTAGSVTVSFSNGDPELSLQSQGAGSWEQTWQTGNATSTSVTLKVHAVNPQGVTGDEVVTGSLASQQQPPVFPNSGIVSAATVVSFTALAPGSAISIYGSRLAETTAQGTLPYPPQLVDTQVFVAGTTAGGVSTGLINLPLYYVSQDQVNAMVPYEVSVDTSLQLLVQRGTTYSVPVQINTAQAQPAVFSASGTPGSAGLIYDASPSSGAQPYFVTANAPAHAGDTIELFCTGLGAVNPSVTDGAAPQQLTNTATTPQLTIGGQSAQVNFSGLAPGFAGLYQVNAVVPSGTQTGANVSITLTIDGQTSPRITIAIE